MLPDDWTGLARVLVIGPAAYLALVLLLRASGKRTLTKLNMFDFVVTVALGSTLASVILTKSVGLVRGIAAFAVLIGLQYAITWLAVRWPAFEGVIKAEPTLLLHNGVFLDRARRAQRVTRAEAEAALRAQGKGEAVGIAAVVLETDGTLTVIAEGRAGAGTLDFHRKGNKA
jgi:uncharacterized membrane protein YcaP (DUF421 family)